MTEVLLSLTLALLALLWPEIQLRHRRRRFLDLVRRELEEAAPYPPTGVGRHEWPEYMRRRFLHRRILEDPSQNRDFILALPPDVAYHLSQMWAAVDEQNADQFQWHLDSLVGLGVVEGPKGVRWPGPEPEHQSVPERWATLLSGQGMPGARRGAADGLDTEAHATG